MVVRDSESNYLVLYCLFFRDLVPQTTFRVGLLCVALMSCKVGVYAFVVRLFGAGFCLVKGQVYCGNRIDLVQFVIDLTMVRLDGRLELGISINAGFCLVFSRYSMVL